MIVPSTTWWCHQWYYDAAKDGESDNCVAKDRDGTNNDDKVNFGTAIDDTADKQSNDDEKFQTESFSPCP